MRIRHRHLRDSTRRTKSAFFAKTLYLYKARARIEQAFGRLKRFKRVALRCEKAARNLGPLSASPPDYA